MRLLVRGSVQYTDPETGLIYLRNRYYDPQTAQFLSSDPLVAITGSAYGYVDDKPLNGTDPSGLCALGVFGKHCHIARLAKKTLDVGATVTAAAAVAADLIPGAEEFGPVLGVLSGEMSVGSAAIECGYISQGKDCYVAIATAGVALASLGLSNVSPLLGKSNIISQAFAHQVQFGADVLGYVGSAIGDLASDNTKTACPGVNGRATGSVSA